MSGASILKALTAHSFRFEGVLNVRSKLMLLSAALVLICGAASAQTAPQKFGVIDMQKALLSTKDGQKAVEDLKAKFGPKEQEFQKRQNDLQAKQDEYRRKENTLSEDAKAVLARDIDAMTKNLQRDTDDARQDVDQEQQRVLNDLGQKMMQVLTKYSAEKGLTMVFDVSGQPNNVLFAASAIDITNEIIKLYDSAPPASSVSSTAAPAAPRPTAPASSAAPRPVTPSRPATTAPGPGK
jgi:outer membrane protein